MERELHCPHCGRVNDFHETPDGKQPKPGDIGICWKCHGLVTLSALGFLRKLTAEEEEEAKDAADVRRALAAMRESYTPQQALDLMRKP